MPGLEDTYHWAHMVGPKIEGGEKTTGVLYHAREKPKAGGAPGFEWSFENRSCSLAPTNMLLVRVMIGKVTDSSRLTEILCSTPVRGGQPGWNCISWIREALERIRADKKALGTSVTEWDTIRNAAMTYCQQKKDQHRFDGQGNFNMSKAPTYDLMQQKETIV
ncbi:hypothetical protein BO94DRAFT_540166 [Aspergillus sclerotioniger CBS 115572]|uniref:Uncharacterized protein n=1 Tax=Aspergillus sclerotioniger CBS 115572 TaxID=1450535 RepID=A0A317V4K7_9EURO|nr:hypothetical protein BO94DRAFT_540166 [Aspergillus sclerotioniger CBS 115572]PWY69035.1 hypothetical protein BO94DRAFT_540166 [Aspergillus sclerotioniger CBS 115572]